MDRFKQAGQAFARLVELMARLRAADGCPWDRKQTLESLRPYLLEEAYETLEAIESGDPQAHREELGDLLLQVVFQSQITHEESRFDVADVCDGISDKLVRRHPHVFAREEAHDAEGALSTWERQKAAERPDRSRLDGVPANLPALLRATRVGEKAAAIGFDWPDVEGVRAKVKEEWNELAGASGDAVEEELGDLLFALSSLARHLGVDAEAALRRATDKFMRRFRVVEQRLGEATERPSIEELEAMWEDAKSSE
jgi:tetrapyrrole methylase family protein/MazG family protein